MALTDHSPRLTVAKGLTAERLREQLDVVARLNEELAPFRILTGIEVDILDDGTLDQDDELLAELDVVVASVHSKLRMPEQPMTDRMVTAMANPHTDILGHCTGRLVVGRGRPESTFDADLVFGVCAHFDKAVEINCRPERLDPPMRLLEKVVALGCEGVDRHRRARSRPARVAALRLRARRRRPGSTPTTSSTRGPWSVFSRGRRTTPADRGARLVVRRVVRLFPRLLDFPVEGRVVRQRGFDDLPLGRVGGDHRLDHRRRREREDRAHAAEQQSSSEHGPDRERRVHVHRPPA